MIQRTRRSFLKTTALGLGVVVAPSFSIPRFGDRLKIGVIGVAGRASANIDGVKAEQIVALCDVDERHLNGVHERFPDAKKFLDFRELVTMKGLDAVVVSTPDHTHAPATMAALNAGLHVYCEKPLTHTVTEARWVRDLANRKGLVTQMGTQIHAGENYRRVVELVQSGVLGPIRRTHVFCEKSWSGDGLPKERPEVPKGLHWDLWLGPAEELPYHPAYHPAGWRRFWRFGGGTLGDMGAHYMDLAHWALDLDWPHHVAATGPSVHAETAPKFVEVTLRHPQKGTRAPVDVTWSDGSARPAELLSLGLSAWRNGVLFVGDEGHLIADYNRHVLLPEAKFKDKKRPEPTLSPSVGHHQEWIDACKRSDPKAPTCRFDYAGPLTESLLLGNVAYRAGRPFDFNAAELTVSDSGLAQRLLSKTYRKGFELRGS